MSGDSEKTPLHDWHRAHGARLVDFAGWSMPVQYTSIVDEHIATRSAAGIFDISHMGRLRFDGPDAEAFLDRLLTRRVAGLTPGKIRYSLITNQEGGILDDVLVYYLQGHQGAAYYMLVVNAGNRNKIVTWIKNQLNDADQITFTDETQATSMIAVQGPLALDAVQPFIAQRLNDLSYYSGTMTTIGDGAGVVSRTGYTGEDGCELIVPAESALALWKELVSSTSETGGRPAGLGARDTLRLEAAMPLYGHELDETLDPYSAGLGFAVQLKDRQFIGRQALVALKQQISPQQRIGLALSGKRVPRQHFDVLLDNEEVGQVTSGTYSPTLQQPIAMAYVCPAAGTVGTEVVVDIRGRCEPARVVELPFYRRSTD